jgi:hypothetical protein
MFFLSRHDQRPILYPVAFTWQNRKMEEHVQALEAQAQAQSTDKAREKEETEAPSL